MNKLKEAIHNVNVLNSNSIFKRVASILINEYKIVIARKEFFISELEFYYYSESHPDPYVHKNDLQKSFGTFYAHPKDGNYGGIDLTLGDEEKDIYCGVLIRGLKDKEENFISGPNLVKKEIYNILKLNNYQELQNCIDEKINFNIIESHNKHEKIFCSTRIGLKPKFEDYIENGKYIYKLHRFIAYDIKSHNFKEKENVKNYNNKTRHKVVL